MNNNFLDNFEHRASVRASLAKDDDWIGQYFGKIVSMFQWQENMTLSSLPGRQTDVLHPEGKGLFVYWLNWRHTFSKIKKHILDLVTPHFYLNQKNRIQLMLILFIMIW